MKSLLAISLAATLATAATRGQSLDQANLEDLVTVAPPSREVVIDIRDSAPANPEPAAKSNNPSPDNPPEPSDPPAPRAEPTGRPAATTPAEIDPPAGVTAEVTGVSGDRVANLDPAKVKIRAPFPAKPLANPPVGWKLARSNNPKTIITRDVELAPGKRLTLRIQPHILKPDADGVEVFSLSEPGYDPAAFYQQTATVAGILAQSVDQSTAAERRLTVAIDQLDQLLLSLPNPDKK